MGSRAISINTVLEYIEKLDSDDQEYLAELLKKRVTEARRTAIAARAEQARENVLKGRCRTGSAKDLMADLDG